MKRTIKIGIIQQTCTNDIRHNLSKLHRNIEQVAAAGAQLVVLQELHNTSYFCQTEDTDMFDLAEPVPGPSTGFYSELAAGYGIVLVTSLFEKRAPGLYHNTAVVFDKDGSIAGKYRKMHIPDDPAYYEKFYFTPGDLGFEPIQTSLGKLGVQVCWDQWYPEGARLMALKGAEILIYPTAIGWESTDTQEEKIRHTFYRKNHSGQNHGGHHQYYSGGQHGCHLCTCHRGNQQTQSQRHENKEQRHHHQPEQTPHYRHIQYKD